VAGPLWPYAKTRSLRANEHVFCTLVPGGLSPYEHVYLHNSWASGFVRSGVYIIGGGVLIREWTFV